MYLKLYTVPEYHWQHIFSEEPSFRQKTIYVPKDILPDGCNVPKDSNFSHVFLGVIFPGGLLHGPKTVILPPSFSRARKEHPPQASRYLEFVHVILVVVQQWLDTMRIDLGDWISKHPASRLLDYRTSHSVPAEFVQC